MSKNVSRPWVLFLNELAKINARITIQINHSNLQSFVLKNIVLIDSLWERFICWTWDLNANAVYKMPFSINVLSSTEIRALVVIYENMSFLMFNMEKSGLCVYVLNLRKQCGLRMCMSFKSTLKQAASWECLPLVSWQHLVTSWAQ